MLTPTQEFRRTHLRAARELPRGLDAVVDQWVGAWRRNHARGGDLVAEALKIDALAPEYAALSQTALKERLSTHRQQLQRRTHEGGNVDALHYALAAIRETASRTLGLTPFVVQLAGALGLYRSNLVEMGTGEGKTLSAGLAAVLHGWTGKPCHVITVNDYLAQRDAEWMRPLFAFCGVKVGFVTGAMSTEERTRGYAQDVTYCTGKEIVADFLRDRLRLGRYQDAGRRQMLLLLQPRLKHLPGVVMRGIHAAIVDEADSVMIDEAVTPVIIAAPHANEPLKEACRTAYDLAQEFTRGSDYRLNDKYREVELLEPGKKKLAEMADRLPALWRGTERQREIVTQALTARELFQDGRHYTVKNGKVLIVDEFTGRIMQQRTWRAGLHQAIEVKEGLDVTDPTETLARLSFQRFFRFFEKLSGMTGTAREAAAEFWHVYRLPVVAIPPNRPCQRVEMPDRILPTAEAKWSAVVGEVCDRHARGQPILIGTRSIAISEMLSERLAALGVEHQVLNALRDREEAAIVARAGRCGAVTIATNMAGRGTDIELGPGVAALGGLHVIGTDRHDSRRVDRQLFGRSARQGDPGSAQTFVSVEDELLQRLLPQPAIEKLAAAVERDWAGSGRMVSLMFDRAQRMTQRIAFKQRLSVLQMDSWLDDALSFAGMEHG